MSLSKVKCFVCNLSEEDDAMLGEMLSKSHLSIHYYCLLSSSNIPQEGTNFDGFRGFRISDIVKAQWNFKDTPCYICKQPSAAINCAHAGCTRNYHYPCGRFYNCMTKFIGEYKSYCHEHVEDTNRIKHNGTYCRVCYQFFPSYNPVVSIFSDCCYQDYLNDGITDEAEMTKEGFTCKQCVQRYAVTAGYDAMCIICGMKHYWTKEKWQDQMRNKGIFIPMAMAKWESDAYFKNQTKMKCVHPDCPTPKSTATVWTCRVCGIQPLHLACAGVTDVADYLCVKCADQSFVKRVPLL